MRLIRGIVSPEIVHENKKGIFLFRFYIKMSNVHAIRGLSGCILKIFILNSD